MSGLALPVDAVKILLDEVRLHGARTEESGAFLLSHEQEPDQIAFVALPSDLGARRRANLFEVPAPALAILFEWAAEEELMIRAQVHSHKRGAFLSWTDLEHGFNVEGFITCVVPRYAHPPNDPCAWGWWEFRGGDWCRREAPAVAAGAAERVRFDAEGTYGS